MKLCHVNNYVLSLNILNHYVIQQVFFEMISFADIFYVDYEFIVLKCDKIS